MTANLHAIWLDDLAPGEGSTPLFDALFAEVDDETRAVILRACADEHTEPVAVEHFPLTDAEVIVIKDKIATAVREAEDYERVVKPTPKRKKPAAKSPLAAQEAKLRTVRGRLADEFKTLGGNDAGAVNELGVAFVCLLGLLLAPVLIAVFG